MSSHYTQPLPPYTPQGGWPPPPAPKKWYQRKAIVIPCSIVAGLFLIGAVGAAFGAGEKKEPAAAPAAAAPTVTVTAPATKQAAAPVQKTTSKAAPTPADELDDDTADSSAESWTMPDETGKTLQAAQDDIQDVTSDGIFFTRSNDALGTGRMQVLDRGWQVCSQNIDAGKKITSDTDIVFDVVRVTEDCP